MILALSAVMMAAGTVAVNAQEKVVTLDQLLKKNQEQKQTQTPQKQETAKPATEKPVKQSKAQSGQAALATPADFNTVYVEYNIESQRYSYEGHSSSESGNSISAGFAHAFALSNTMPLYVEPGIAAKYVWKKEDGSKFNMLSLKVPVNLVFAYPVSDAFTIAPYAGAYLRFNLFGKQKIDSKYTDWDDEDWGDVDDWDDWYGARSQSKTSVHKVKDSYDVFSKDDMGDDAWNRFNVGMQVGVRAHINNMFVVGVGYTQELTNICDHTKFSSVDLTLGIAF